jgi:hypothetical protein
MTKEQRAVRLATNKAAIIDWVRATHPECRNDDDLGPYIVEIREAMLVVLEADDALHEVRLTARQRAEIETYTDAAKRLHDAELAAIRNQVEFETRTLDRLAAATNLPRA